jgi:hypothetical protein
MTITTLSKLAKAAGLALALITFIGCGDDPAEMSFSVDRSDCPGCANPTLTAYFLIETSINDYCVLHQVSATSGQHGTLRLDNVSLVAGQEFQLAVVETCGDINCPTCFATTGDITLEKGKPLATLELDDVLSCNIVGLLDYPFAVCP